jgi:hypothetical protein
VVKRVLVGALTTWLCLLPANALAEQPARPPSSGGAATPPASEKAAPRAKAAPKLAEVPLSLRVLAASPDPPWLLVVENTGDRPIRVPADERLLSFDLRPKPKSAAIACKLPAAMVPTEFDDDRELVLEAGESLTIAIDPRLYCFGSSVDKLVPGATLVPRFGFAKFAQSKDAFVAAPLDAPSTLAPRRFVQGEPFVLPAVPTASPTPPTPPGPTPTEDAGPVSGAPASSSPASSSPASSSPPASTTPLETRDRRAPQLDVYVEQRVDAHAGRDVVLTIRAVNEGERKLKTVLRTRMLRVRVEELRADNEAAQETLCTGQHAAHGVASEHVTTLGTKGQSTLSLLVAELCPKETFRKPGLYRLRAEIDTSVEGESLKADPWLLGALARQSALARVATGRAPFHVGHPSAGPLELPPRSRSANSNAERTEEPSPQGANSQ